MDIKVGLIILSAGLLIPGILGLFVTALSKMVGRKEYTVNVPRTFMCYLMFLIGFSIMTIIH